MSRDLVIIKGSSFVKPETSTEDELQQATQAYATIFLTEIGSVEQIPAQGSDFELGSVNTNRFIFFANKINNQVFNQIKEPYNIVSSNILDLTSSGDKIDITIRLRHTSGETSEVTI